MNVAGMYEEPALDTVSGVDMSVEGVVLQQVQQVSLHGLCRCG